jgi:hypothetical protein
MLETSSKNNNRIYFSIAETKQYDGTQKLADQEGK